MHSLLPHQVEAVERSRLIHGMVFNNSETGTGKSRMAVAIALDGHRAAGEAGHRGLIIAHERNLMGKWVRELEALGESGFVLNGLPALKRARGKGHRWVVVSHASFTRSKAVKEILRELAPTFTDVIIDEVHKLKNRTAKSMQGWRRFIERIAVQRAKADKAMPRIQMLSATPIIHNPADILAPYVMAGMRSRLDELDRCVSWRVKRQRVGEKEFVQKTAIKWHKGPEALAILRRNRIHVRKADCFPPAAPPTVFHPVLVDVDAKELADMTFELMKRSWRLGLPKKKREPSEEEKEWILEAYRRAASNYSLGQQILTDDVIGCAEEGGMTEAQRNALAMQVVNATLQAEGVLLAPGAAVYAAELAREGKLVVFAEHKRPLRIFAEALPEGLKPVFIHGDQTNPQNKAAEMAFRQGDAPVLCGTYRKAGSGIELTPALHCLILQRSYAPADVGQAVNRIHRLNTIGQTRAHTARARTADGTVLRIERALGEIHERKWRAAMEVDVHGELHPDETDHPYLSLRGEDEL